MLINSPHVFLTLCQLNAKSVREQLLRLSETEVTWTVYTVYTASLRQQLQDSGKKLVGAMHFNKDGSINGRYEYPSFYLVEVWKYLVGLKNLVTL